MTSTWISRTLAALRSAGGRVTDQRRLILAEIDAAPAGMSAEELVAAVRQADGDASRSTVYRTLDLLREIDAVETVHPSPEQHRYLARRTPDQHHVVCEQCSSVALIDRLHIRHDHHHRDRAADGVRHYRARARGLWPLRGVPQQRDLANRRNRRRHRRASRRCWEPSRPVCHHRETTHRHRRRSPADTGVRTISWSQHDVHALCRPGDPSPDRL